MSRHIEPRPCATCGQEFTSPWKARVYCGDRCKRTAENTAARVRDHERASAAAGAHALSWGRWSTRENARAALRARMIQDGGWWGPPMVARWAELHGVPFEGAIELLTELSLEGRVHARGRELAQWRAA